MRRISVLLLAAKNTNPQLFRGLGVDKIVRFMGAMSIQETLQNEPAGLDPDVVLLYDAGNNPNYNGLLPKIKSIFPSARVLVLGEKQRDEVVMKVISLGGDGYMVFPAPPLQLLCAIKDCEQGILWASRRVLSEMVRRATPAQPAALSNKTLQELITPRQAEVINLLIRGLSNKDIATALGVQEITVKVHISNLLKNLHFKNRCALVSSVVAGRLPN